jgi:hypothetical protein
MGASGIGEQSHRAWSSIVIEMHKRVIAQNGQRDVAALGICIGECETKSEVQQRPSPIR